MVAACTLVYRAPMHALLLALSVTATTVGAAPPPPDAGVDLPTVEAKLQVSRPYPAQELTKELKVTASSSLCEGKGAKRSCHDASRLTDGRAESAWCEGRKGDGEGETLTFDLGGEREVLGVDVVGYYAKDMRRATKNGRPAELIVKAGAQKMLVQLPDHVSVVQAENLEKGRNVEGCGDETCASWDDRIGFGEGYFAAFPKPVRADKVTVTLHTTLTGDEFEDTCMSELHVWVSK